MTRRTAASLTLLALAGLALVAPPAVAAPPAPRTVVALGHTLPLGPAGLAETRTTRTLQPGVTLTRIVRGHTDPSAVWTVELIGTFGSTRYDPEGHWNGAADSGRLGDLRPRGVDPDPR